MVESWPIQYTDPTGTKIELTEGTFYHHILEEHGEMKEPIIREGIENPHKIYQDANYEDRRIYLRIIEHPFDEPYPTHSKVVVEETSSGPDQVVTSHVMTNLKGESGVGEVLYDASTANTYQDET